MELADDECIICRGPFRDAHFCSDGWSYCRDCILRWAEESGMPWKSPKTNQLVYTTPLLVRDERLRCASIQRMHAQLQEVIAQRDAIQAIRVCADLGVASSESEKVETIALISEGVVLTVDEFWAAFSIVRFTETHILSLLVSSVVEQAIKEDLTDSRRPLVQIGILEELARAACRYGILDLAIMLVTHLCRRSTTCDAIVLPPQQPRSRFEGRYERCAYCSDALSVKFTNARTEAILTIHRDGSPAVIQTAGGEQFSLGSMVAMTGPPDYWEARRGPLPPPLPIEEEQVDWRCPHDCLIFEQPPPYLPETARYLPHVRREVSRSDIHAELLQLLSETSAECHFFDDVQPKRRRRRR